MISIRLADAGSFDALRKTLRGMPRHVREAGWASILKEAQLTMDTAQAKVPVVTGQLRSSASIKVLKNAVDVRYTAPHAVYVHEIPYSGKTTKGKLGALRNGQGYKWLELAARQVFAGSAKRMADAIRAAIKRGK
jgi:hypothetical protein